MTDEKMLARVQPIASDLQAGKAYADALIISNAAELEQTQVDLKELKRRQKALKDALAEFTAPAKAIIEAAESLFNPQIQLSKQIEETVKDKCTAFRQTIEAEKAKRLLEAQRIINAQAPVPDQRLAIAAVNEMSAPKTSGVSYIDHYVYSVDEPAKLPERYWVVSRVINHRMLQDEVDAGTRAIDGCKIVNQPIMRVGTK